MEQVAGDRLEIRLWDLICRQEVHGWRLSIVCESLFVTR